MQPSPPEITEVQITREMIRAYAARFGDATTLASDCLMAPPTFVLSLRRGFSPHVNLPPNHFAVYGGHDLSFHAPLRAGQSYRVSTRLIESYRKSGRSGPMQIVVRRAEIVDAGDLVVAEMIERQVVRERQPGAKPPTVSPQATYSAATSVAPLPPAALMDPDFGDVLGPDLRVAPAAAIVAGYAADNHVYESLFVDQDFARSLGYRDVIVPGPMQTAFLEQFLRRHLPSWTLAVISVTFRMSIISGDTLRLTAVVTDREAIALGSQINCDLLIESSDGERASTGHAILKRADGPK